MADNLQTTQAINNLLIARQALIQETNKELTKQVALQRDLCNAIECADTDTFENLRNHMKDAAQAAAEGEREFNKLNRRMSRSEKITHSLGRAVGKLKGGISGFATAFGVGVASIFGFLQKMYKGYVNSMYKVIQQLEDVQRSQEEVRNNFGSLTEGPGKMVIDDARAMGRSFQEMGVSAGYAYKATTYLNNMMNQLYSSMDPAQFAGMAAMTGEARKEMLKLGLAAGLSGEQIGVFNNTMRAMGEDSVSAMKDITRRSHLMRRVLGISAKQAMKGFVEMTRNVKAFGNANRQQMQDAMMKATQLGISIKDLSGIADAFFTFDQAAENVSKLSQAFGVQLDVMGLVSAESPADQMDQLRKAMFAAGKSAETLSRHEMQLLASSTGLSAEAARMAFSMENQYKSQEEINALIGETDPQKQMAQAMKDVAKEIKNVVVGLTELVDSGTGPLGAFIQGIGRGLFFLSAGAGESAMTFKEMITAITTIGSDLGEYLRGAFLPFVDFFGAIDNTHGGMVGIFENISKAIKSMVPPLNVAYTFFKLFFATADPKKQAILFDEMVKQIKSAFGNLFSSLSTSLGGNTSGAGDLGKGLKAFFEMAIRRAAPYVFDSLVSMATAVYAGFMDWWGNQDNKTKLGVAIGGLFLAAPGFVLGIAARSLMFLGKGIVKLLWKGIAKGGGFLIKNMSKMLMGSFRALAFVAKKFPLIALVVGAIRPLLGLFDDWMARFEKVATSSESIGGRIMNGLGQLPGMLWDLLGRVAEWGMNFVNILTFGLFKDKFNTANFKETWDLFTLELKDLIMGSWTWVKEAGSKLWTNLKEGLSNGWQAVSEFISDKLDYIRGFFPSSEPKRGPLRGLAESGVSMFRNFGQGFREAAGKVGNMLGGVADALNPLSRVRSLFTSYLETMKFVSSVMRQVNDLFSGVGRGSVNVDIMTDRIAKVGEAIVKMNAALAEVNTVQLRTKIEELVGSSLLTGDENAEAGKFIINLNVTMDADDVARVLVKNNLVVAP